MNSDDPGGTGRGSARFPTTPRKGWASVPSSEWDDWRWQLRNRLFSLAGLEQHLSLSLSERRGAAAALHRLKIGITPYFLGLIDRHRPSCPIRRQVLPSLEETFCDPDERDDPINEEAESPVPGLVHRYPDRVLLLATDRCAGYCRYCTRSRMVGGRNFHLHLKDALAYLKKHTEVRDVLLSGGDPLLLSDEKLGHLLSSIRAISHVEFVRIGTRMPVFLPQRITPALCAILRRHHPLWMSIHVNHPGELSAEARQALEQLSDAGIPLGSQSVLLTGVNDDLETMKTLVHKLLLCRVRPYYLYQCDLIRGSRHFRAPIGKGLEIIEGLRGFTSGYAVPQLVIDAPGGGGKVPINPDYVIYRDAERVVFRNYKGKIFEYPEPSAAAIPPTPPSLNPEYALQN
ncbi:MAG: KamA family radical SAM protein [Verrucomicrobiae bacterium]|nr:KamA family radical SAM protein [Verrucomicrobiae bacterium]